MENCLREQCGISLLLLATSLGVISCQRAATPTMEKLPDPAGIVKIEKPSYKLKDGAPLDEQTAIQAAEKFIADNGYTDLPPLKDSRQLTYESLEWESDPEKMLQHRHDTLQRKAYSISPHGRNGAGWTVGFRFKNGDTKTGRAVTMDKDGGNIRVEHVDVFLQKLEKKLSL